MFQESKLLIIISELVIIILYWNFKCNFVFNSAKGNYFLDTNPAFPVDMDISSIIWFEKASHQTNEIEMYKAVFGSIV